MYAKSLEVDLVVEQPDDLFSTFKQSFALRYFGENEVVYIATEKFSKHTQPNQIREALMKGYVEMSHINLTICSECLHAEYEAEHMVERLVSGG